MWWGAVGGNPKGADFVGCGYRVGHFMCGLLWLGIGETVGGWLSSLRSVLVFETDM